MGEMLFEGYDPAEPAPVEKVSADRRRTLRQAAYVAAGIHPLTKGRLHPLASRNRDATSPKSDPFTCGSCYFREVVQYHDYSYPKCCLPGPDTGQVKQYGAVTVTIGYPRVSHSNATDVRAWWPACPDYQPGDSSLSPDAARSIP